MSAGRTNEWKLGLFIVTAIAVGVAGLAWLGASRLRKESYEAIAFFDETVDGLDPGSPVKFLGVTIGQVKRITLAEDSRHVMVTSEIYLDELDQLGLPTEFPTEVAPVDAGLRIQLVSSALTGVAFLEGRFFDPEQYPPPTYPFVIPPNTLHTAPSTLKSLEEGLVDAMKSIPRVVEETAQILERVETAIGELQLKQISARTLELMASLKDRLDTLEDMPVLKEGAAAMADARVTLEEIRVVVERLGGEEGKIAQALLRYEELGVDVQTTLHETDLPGVADSLRGLSGEVGDAAHEVGLLSTDVRTELRTMREAFESIQSLAASLERDPGALVFGKTTQQRPNRN